MSIFELQDLWSKNHGKGKCDRKYRSEGREDTFTYSGERDEENNISIEKFTCNVCDEELIRKYIPRYTYEEIKEILDKHKDKIFVDNGIKDENNNIIYTEKDK